jgi:hypothetical protein
MADSTFTADNLGKYMSLASVWMVICGIAFNYFYFYHFNILITEYIDLSESLLMFVPIAIKVLGSITAVFIVFLVLQVINKAIGNKAPDTSEKFGKYLFKVIMFTIFLTAIEILVDVVFGKQALLSHKFLLKMLFLYLGIFASASIFFGIGVGFIGGQFIKLFILLSSLSFIAFGLSGYYSKINEVENMQFTVGYKCILADSTLIETDSSHLFVGQTKAYLFIYDAKKKIVTVLNRSKIKQISFEPFKTSSLWWPAE